MPDLDELERRFSNDKAMRLTSAAIQIDDAMWLVAQAREAERLQGALKHLQGIPAAILSGDPRCLTP